MRRREKKAKACIEQHLDWALSSFSGYLAVDELYDGPFCVLSAVDSPRQRRVLYEVLDHAPKHQDIVRFLQRVKDAVTARGGKVHGITTDGSQLYPEPIQQVFGEIPHQVCEFHILKELNKTILRIVAQLRKRLAAQAPKLGRGRPRGVVAQRKARQRKAIQERVSELFDHRHLFVRHHLTPSQRKKLQHLIRGQTQLRTVREIMDEVYRLFDRRCRTDTALTKLARLRQRLSRFKSLTKLLSKLKSPNLEKALTFLDDKLMPSTSNAVERGNRRHRKMQKTVYRARTQESIVGRMALDLQRDQRSDDRATTLNKLHKRRTIAA
ncbi:MAG: transposase [Acidobacteriota bacterium]